MIVLIVRNRWFKNSTVGRVVEAIKPIFAYDHEKRELVEVGKRDFNSYVASFYEASLLKNKLLRFQNGDLQALNVRQGVYTDISGMPTDYNSLHNLVTRANDIVHQSGKNDIPEYIQGALELLVKEPELKKESEVIENE